jgi:hypothetical protein
MYPSSLELPPNVFFPSIIFVHGLKGDREVTWTAPDATDPWSKTLLPGIFPAARILTFGYDPSVPKSQGVMPEDIVAKHAHDLLESLSSSRKKEDGTVGQQTLLMLHCIDLYRIHDRSYLCVIVWGV